MPPIANVRAGLLGLSSLLLRFGHADAAQKVRGLAHGLQQTGSRALRVSAEEYEALRLYTSLAHGRSV